jgi:sRNA-binding carbon storage regulator CsrA
LYTCDHYAILTSGSPSPKGLLGLLVKPSIGVTDLLTDTLHGVKGSVEGATSEGLSILNCQVRPRRALYGSDRVVKTYRIDDATASVIQSKLNTIGGENYYSHVDMVKNVALMSVTRLLILSEDGNEELLLRFDEISRVEILQPSTDVVRIHLNSDVNAVKEVKCEDEEIANRLRQKISEAINYTAV